MAKARYFSFSADEYLVGIRKLNGTEQGAYWLCCSLMYSENAPIVEDFDELADLLKFRVDHTKRIIDKLVRLGKLQRIVGDDGVVKLSCPRVVTEVSASRRRAEANAENGRKGGRPKRKPAETLGSENPPGSFSESLNNKVNCKEEEKGSLDLTPSPKTQKTSLESALGGAAKYRFEGDVIRLTPKDFDKLKRLFPNLNGSFERELAKADAYYHDNPPEKPDKWWFLLNRWLSKADEAAAPPASGPPKRAWL